MYKQQFFTFIFAVLLRFCGCSVVIFRVRSTWYGVRGPHYFWGAPVAKQPLPAKFGIGVTATYYSSDSKNGLYYRISRGQPYKLLYKLMSSALFRKIWCIIFIQSGATDIFLFHISTQKSKMAAAGILCFEVVNLTIPACRQCEIWDLCQIWFKYLL